MKNIFSNHRVLFLLGVLTLLNSTTTLGQRVTKVDELNTKIYSSEIDSLLASMSREEQIAQLFWIPVFAPGAKIDNSALISLVDTYQPGGLLYFATDPEQLVELTNQLQKRSKIPLIISLDGEWGLGMRINNSLSFPYQMTLGAIKNDTLIYKMGIEVARQFMRMGMHVNFAPVVDVNVNPANPVINYRSFGENPYKVASKSLAYMNGMQDGGIMAVAKHFPGHGDTNQDSHKTLPLITQTRQRLDSVELYPFRKMVDAGVLGIMSAHLEVPALEPVKGCPASLSKSILTDLLRQELGFKGLIITDAMNMNGVKKAGQPGKVDALALIAGNDIIEFTESLPDAIREVKLAVDSGLITWTAIELKVRRALALKQMLKVDGEDISTMDLRENLFTTSAISLNRELYRKSITVLTDSFDSRLPLKSVKGERTFVLAIGDNDGFLEIIKRDSSIETATLSYAATSKEISYLIKRLKGVDNLVLALSDVKKISNTKKAKKSQKTLHFINDLSAKQNPIVVYFGNPYSLDAIKNYTRLKTIVIAYQDNSFAQEECAKVLLGEYGFDGHLPVSVDSKLVAGMGAKSTYPLSDMELSCKPVLKIELIEDVLPNTKILSRSVLLPRTDSTDVSTPIIASDSLIVEPADANSGGFFNRMMKRVKEGRGDSIPRTEKQVVDTIAKPLYSPQNRD